MTIRPRVLNLCGSANRNGKGMMNRKLKLLGIALSAFCVMSGMGASAANAAQFTTTSGATLTGTEIVESRFTVTGIALTCESVLVRGTAPAASFTSVTMSPQYTGCKTSLGTTITITGLGHLASEEGKPKCGYRLFASGTSELECEAGGEVKVDAATCSVHIPEQHLPTGVTYSDNPAGNDIEVDFEFNTTTTHTDGFLCPLGSSGHSTGMLEGKATVVAEVNGKQVDATFDP